MRLIDADAFDKRLVRLGALSIKSALDEEPTIEAEPVRHGYWIPFLDGDSIMPERFFKCSCCGRVERRKEPYCHCGAKMDNKRI